MPDLTDITYRYVPFDDPIVTTYVAHDWSRHELRTDGAIHMRAVCDGEVFNRIWPTKLSPEEVADLPLFMQLAFEGDMEKFVEAER